jgi:hypothetical protein
MNLLKVSIPSRPSRPAHLAGRAEVAPQSLLPIIIVGLAVENRLKGLLELLLVEVVAVDMVFDPLLGLLLSHIFLSCFERGFGLLLLNYSYFFGAD